MRTKLLKWLVRAAVVGAMWGIASCYSYHLNLHDYYYITRYVKRNGDRYYFLECNPGYPLRDGVARVDDVVSVAWNSRLIVVEQMAGGTEETGESVLLAAAGCVKVPKRRAGKTKPLTPMDA